MKFWIIYAKIYGVNGPHDYTRYLKASLSVAAAAVTSLPKPFDKATSRTYFSAIFLPVFPGRSDGK
jgi:hypothetical protein